MKLNKRARVTRRGDGRFKGPFLKQPWRPQEKLLSFAMPRKKTVSLWFTIDVQPGK